MSTNCSIVAEEWSEGLDPRYRIAAWLHKSDREGILRNHCIKVDSIRPSHARLSRPRVMHTESISEGTRGTTPGQFLSSLFLKTN
jgi:hypothetical protein